MTDSGDREAALTRDGVEAVKVECSRCRIEGVNLWDSEAEEHLGDRAGDGVRRPPVRGNIGCGNNIEYTSLFKESDVAAAVQALKDEIEGSKANVEGHSCEKDLKRLLIQFEDLVDECFPAVVDQ